MAISSLEDALEALRAVAARAAGADAAMRAMQAAAADALMARDPEEAMRATLRLILAAEDVAASAGATVQAARAALCRAIEETGAPAVVAGKHLATVAAGKPGVRITDPAAIPDRFVRTVREPDKAKIARALKAGEPVAGAMLNNPAPHLRIQTREATR
ncbi:hypothetical protein GCM10010964_43320 [Caldovatus sediminis]|uniref:Uncharacterized protein n=1 Tax=Caldovatus sediminis TaxID=2041189 RepID=A0A8J2ZFS9_9PROT|nr:siphovirus Gp157 family protein [Caldovatus sediminis]GGG51410.1 hypothetical protein GCM10010964_43320 [Caldovatus sediminis]